MFDPEFVKGLILQYGYLALFLGAAVEGFHVMLLAGFLSAIHYLDLFPAFLAVSAGCYLADSTIFYLGYFGGRRLLDWLAKHLKRLGHSLEPARKYLHENPARVFLLVKITTGLAIATILTAGASRMRPRKFMFWNLMANLVVAAIMIALGYFFGQSYVLIYKIFHYWAFTFLAVFILAFLMLNHYLAGKFAENQKTSD
jgi:membrane protein DedA with SNARE-associated domain